MLSTNHIDYFIGKNLANMRILIIFALRKLSISQWIKKTYENLNPILTILVP